VHRKKLAKKPAQSSTRERKRGRAQESPAATVSIISNVAQGFQLNRCRVSYPTKRGQQLG